MDALATRGLDEVPPVLPKGVSRLQLAAKILFCCVLARLLVPVIFSGAPIGSVVFGLAVAGCLPAWGYFRAVSAKGWELGALGCCSLCCSLFSLISCCCLFVAAGAATGLVALAPTVCGQSNDTFDLILAHHAASKDGTIDLTEVLQTISEQLQSDMMDPDVKGAGGRGLMNPLTPPQSLFESALTAVSSQPSARRLIRIREGLRADEQPPQWAKETAAGETRPMLGGGNQVGKGTRSSSNSNNNKLRPDSGGKIPITAEEREQIVEAKEEVNQWCIRQGFSRESGGKDKTAAAAEAVAAHGQGVTDGGDVQRLSKLGKANGKQTWFSKMPGTTFNGKYDASVDILAKDMARGLRLMGALEFACAIATILLGVRAIQLSGAVEERGAYNNDDYSPPLARPGASTALEPVGAAAIERQASGEPESVARSRITTAGRQLGSALASPEPSAPLDDSGNESGTKEVDP